MSFKRSLQRHTTVKCCECPARINVPNALSLEERTQLLATHGWVLSLTDPKRKITKPLCETCARIIYGDTLVDEALRIIREKAPGA